MNQPNRFQPPASASFDGPTVVLVGPVLVDMANLIRRGVREQRREGISPNPTLSGVIFMIDSASKAWRASMSPRGHSAGAVASTRAELITQTTAEPLSTAEVAALLGRSPRHVRRLAPKLGARRVGAVLVFERAAVEEYMRASRSAPKRR